MSLKKIIFLAWLALCILALIVWARMLTNNKVDPLIPKSITIWINQGSSEDYSKLISWFYQSYPDYRNMKIIVEKKTSDKILYRTLLLSTLTDSLGPDIFMMNSWEDRILESKRQEIPVSFFTKTDFERDYADIFLGLFTWSLESKGIMWIPIGFETLWIFYNKALIREVPVTWNDVEILSEKNLGTSIFPTNLGLGPTYTPNSADIMSIFSIWKNNSYEDLSSGKNALNSYISYQKIKTQSLWISQDSNEGESITPWEKWIKDIIPYLEEKKYTTYDAFMQWDIWLIIGFPSLALELEKSAKRVGSDSIENLVLTAPIPGESTAWEKVNKARYPYLALSKNSKSSEAAATFLSYLTEDDAIRIVQETYPYLIPPKPALYSTWKDKPLSKVLSRTKLDAFIPDPLEKIMTFDYWLKPEFNAFLIENIDRTENIDIENIWTRLSHNITCTLSIYFWGWVWSDCEK